MIYKTVLLKDFFPELKSNATLTSYCISNHEEYPFNKKRKTILIIPGGGYEFVSLREAEPIAIKFLAHDFNCFVLRYTVGKFVYPYPIIEGFAALAFIHKFADEYNVDINNISTIGFSAGGHFAATLACYKEKQEFADFLRVKTNYFDHCKCILSYPVITLSGDTHQGTRDHITQNRLELADFFSIEKHVTKNYPETMIWTTKEDTCVPYTNSALMHEALDKANVYNEFYLFEHGDHGGATCDEMTCDPQFSKSLSEASSWIEKAIRFLNR